MEASSGRTVPSRYWLLFVPALLVITAIVTVQTFQAANGELAAGATYTHGMLDLTIPYHAAQAGAGKLSVEVLDPEDHVLGSAEKTVDAVEGKGRWHERIALAKPLAIDELVWHRVRYRFEYSDGKSAKVEGAESISEILRTPVVHILGQQSYLTGGEAAVRVIVTDSHDEIVEGRGSVRIELLVPERKSQLLFSGQLNRRGTTEAQFRFPAGVVGSYQLRYLVDTAIGSTEFIQPVRLEDKVSILLTTEKPIYQPGQTIHARALALDRANHEAAAGRKLTFEVEDSRGNKVFKKATQTDKFGIASAEFGLADEVNLGTYHLRALLGGNENESESPTNTAEIALNVERYVLPKFKVAIDFAGSDHKTKRGYRPGDHVTGTVRANYFFGKPVDDSAVIVKASSMDVSMFTVGSTQGRTDHDGTYHFDLTLPTYFAGRPLSQGAARVLIEATVKDSADHSEARGEPITVSESPLLITAVPEGGTLVPDLENQVFILTSYPDGTPARASLKVNAEGQAEQTATTDDGGVAVIRVSPSFGALVLEIEGKDQEGNHAASAVQLQSREGDDQILLRTERAVYKAGDRIDLRVFSTKKRGTAYLDVVKDGQTVLTRDIDIENGQAELSLTATPELAGTVDFNAYLFSRNARPVADHRLVFVQPADELKIDAVADAPGYKPGADARVRFRVTNSRGEGVSAALGLQVVDEAVFALAEKQPGFAKVFFYLEQEVMKPRYEIHSIGMSEVVEPVEESKVEQRDRAARALFSATEMVSTNNFETEFGRTVPMTKYQEYAGRYQAQFLAQVRHVAEDLSRAYRENSEKGDLTKVFARVSSAGNPDFQDAWGTELRVEPVQWYRNKTYYMVHSAGADHRFGSGDDMAAYIEVHTGSIVGQPNSGTIDLNIEHDRGAFNGLAEIVGTVTDPSGAVVPGANVNLREVSSGKTRTVSANASGQFDLAGLAAGKYEVQVSLAGFKIASRELTLQARDRAVLSVNLAIGEASEVVEVEAAGPMLPRLARAGVAGGVPGGVTGGAIASVINGRMEVLEMAPAPSALPMSARDVAQSSAILTKDKKEEASPSAHVRSYFPEALYINPEIITDSNGVASITIPLADSITTWRMAMLASTTHGALGSATSSLKVFQDFFVDLDLPVTLTQGDRVSIPVAVYNYSGGRGDVSLKLQPDDWFSLVDDVADKSVTVDSARVGGSQFTLEARRIGKFKLTLSARMKGAADRADIVVREIEVIPNGREQNLVFNGRLETSVRHELNFPANSIPDASKIFVRLYPGPLSQVIEGMDSILRMPGGCFEQTSSSTYPNVLALDYMKRTKKLTPEVHAKAEGYIANGYQRLLTFEVPGGGFSWFGQAPANKILTAYGLMEFSDMSKVYDVDPRLIARTQQWLASQQQADGSWKPDTQFINEGATNRYNSDVLRITAYLAWSLENTGYQGPAVDRARQFVESHMNGKIDTYTLAVIANFAVDFGGGDHGSGSSNHEKDRSFTRQAMQLLLDARTEKDEQAWWSADETGVYATGASASVETTGLAVQALLKWGEASGTAHKAMNYIASKKDATGAWGTTQATIMALRALLLATEKGAADVRGNLEVLLNGNVVEKLTLTPENNDLLHQFVFKSTSSKDIDSKEVGSTDADSEHSNSVEIRFEGKGGLAYQVVGSYYLPWDQKPANEALSIDVAYDRTHLAQDDIAAATATVRNNLPRRRTW